MLGYNGAMGSRKKEGSFPEWAPADLAANAEALRRKAEEEIHRTKAHRVRALDKKSDLENERLHIGMYFVGHATQYEYSKALLTAPQMESVWKSLQRRASSFKPKRFLFGGGALSQASNLLSACVEAEVHWINIPKRTRTQSRKLHKDIASLALQLTELLLQVESRELLDTRKFIDEKRQKDFKKALEKDGLESWYGFDGYFDHLLGELLEPIPGVLLKLHKRALEHAEYPLAVSQPNSPNAKVHHFIVELSEYFTQAYGQPLHAHVAAVVSAVLNVEIDEDRVRALLRARKAAIKRHTRKKMDELREEIAG